MNSPKCGIIITDHTCNTHHESDLQIKNNWHSSRRGYAWLFAGQCQSAKGNAAVPSPQFAPHHLYLTAIANLYVIFGVNKGALQLVRVSRKDDTEL